jgi:hypothetical protein
MLSTHLHLGLPSSSFQRYMPRPPHSPRLDNSDYTWRRVQITHLLVMQFSPPSRHSIPLRSKFSSQHRLLKHPRTYGQLNYSSAFHESGTRWKQCASRRGRFVFGAKNNHCPFYRRLMGPSRSEERRIEKNLLLMPRLEPRPSSP